MEGLVLRKRGPPVMTLSEDECRKYAFKVKASNMENYEQRKKDYGPYWSDPLIINSSKYWPSGCIRSEGYDRAEGKNKLYVNYNKKKNTIWCGSNNNNWVCVEKDTIFDVTTDAWQKAHYNTKKVNTGFPTMSMNEMECLKYANDRNLKVCKQSKCPDQITENLKWNAPSGCVEKNGMVRYNSQKPESNIVPKYTSGIRTGSQLRQCGDDSGWSCLEKYYPSLKNDPERYYGRTKGSYR